MQSMLIEYDDLHSATGGHVENNKTNLFSWKYVWKQGIRVAVKVPVEIVLNNVKLKELEVKEANRSLGVYMAPTLKWEKQFAIMVDKLNEAMSKLKKVPISIVNAHLYYNMYLLRRVYFGCGIMQLMPNQEKELIKISEPILLKKMGLSINFPRKLLYARKSALGVGLIKPSTMILILSMRLYAGHVRAGDRISNIIRINEENAMFQNGYSSNVLKAPERDDKEVATWSEEIGWELQKRGIEIINNQETNQINTTNKTIMDYAQQYRLEKEESKLIIPPINQVRVYKRMYLPCELVGFCGSKETKGFRRNAECSEFQWNVEFARVPKPSKKSFNI